MNNFDTFGIEDGSCDNYSIRGFNAVFPQNTCNNKLFTMNFNMQSFNAKIDEFSTFLNDLNLPPKILCLTETWFTPLNIQNIPGYKPFHSIRNGDRNHGGVSIQILDSIPVNCTEISSKSSLEIEYVHVRLIFKTRNMKKIDVVGIYRPPSSSMDEFLSSLEILLNNIPATNDIILLGDFNICGLTPSTSLNNFVDVMCSYSLMPHINIITRPNPHGADSLIDHTWTNFGFKFQSGVFNEILISDHYISFTFLPLILDTEKKKISFRDHSEENILKMIAALTNFRYFFPLLTLTLDLNSKFDLFYDEIDRIYKTCCPIRTKEISSAKFIKPWITSEILASIRAKYDLFKRFKNGQITFDVFKTYKKELKKKLKQAKHVYFRNKYKNYQGDSSSTWKITISIFSRKNTPNIPPMINHNRKDISNHSEMCKIFNNYFVNIGANLANTITGNATNPLNYMGSRCVNSFNFMGTTSLEVFNIIKKFKNKKSSVNNIPISVFKKVSHVISPLLSELFNESINVGVFPNKLKTARVVPLFKEGSKTNILNYRPISTLSIYSKIFEKLVHKRMVSFISRYNIIKPNQYGFQTNKSTSDAIIEFLENINDSFNENKHHLSIYLDFSKAFDTVCHEILLKKIEHMGFRGPILQWITSYLTNRKQFVTIGDASSPLLDISMGVPQGSTLGPLLFILYINDMSNSLSCLKTIHFADDSTLHLTMNKNENIALRVNAELAIINTWLISNKLFLNIDKTKYMIFSIKDKPPDLRLEIGNSLIQRTNVQKFLGIYIDDRLTFRDHVNKICAKMSQRVGVMRRLRVFLPRDILKQLFYTFIYSRFTYGITCYGSAYLNQIQRIKKVINRSLKLVFNSTVLTPELLKREKVLDFDMAYKYFCQIKMYKILRLNNHESLASKIESFQTHHAYDTRAVSLNELTSPLYRRTKCQNSFVYRGIKFWKIIPPDIRNIPDDLNAFKTRLKRSLLT